MIAVDVDKQHRTLRLIRFCTVCLQMYLQNLNEFETHYPTTLKFEMDHSFNQDGLISENQSYVM